MQQELFSVDLEKEQLNFSAAHFITFGDNICESIHGHNYRVRCRVVGPLNEHGYVVDFIALRDRLAELTTQLDHHVLLPMNHPTISVSAEKDEVVVRFEKRRWVFPAQDCRLLPLTNTTAELLAQYLADSLIPTLLESAPELTIVEVGVDENEGQWGTCLRKLK
ncbi:MAG: 6-pyruvoyl tetrahydropterin synthase family protein [Pirellulaceae bacterium]